MFLMIPFYYIFGFLFHFSSLNSASILRIVIFKNSKCRTLLCLIFIGWCLTSVYHGWLVLKCLTQMKSVGKKWLLNAIQFWNVVDRPLCQKSLTGREIQRFAHKFYKVGETERLISLHTNFRRWDVFVQFCPLVHFDRKTTTTKFQTFLKILCLTFLLFLLVFFFFFFFFKTQPVRLTFWSFCYQ